VRANIAGKKTEAASPRPQGVSAREVRELSGRDYDRVVALLSEDPLQGVHLKSMVEDHGICHPAHRGRFFGYFEDHGLAGVALLGHLIMIYATSEAEAGALKHFARVAAEIRAKGHVIFGPREQVQALWRRLSQSGRETRLLRDYYWYVCQQPRLPLERMQLRQASLDELEIVAEAHAEMALEESGIDPRLADPEGFRQRVRGRIERRRTWVKLEDGKVVFKAELQSITAEAIYLEGIWVHPEYRSRGIAKSCVTELAHRRLSRQQVLCLVVEPGEQAARHVYEQVGFERYGDYQARYLKPPAEAITLTLPAA
jgi:hypothetical protein